jgi:uncharacterized delta-60 repeat protein
MPLGIALQPDGKIVAAGTTFGLNGRDFALARYNSDGSLDTGFGINGSAVMDLYHQDDNATRVAVAPDGKIVMVGSTEPNELAPGPPDFAIVSFDNGRATLMQTPIIGNAYFTTNGLTIKGVNFDDGAIILVDGQEQTTTPGWTIGNPTGVLIAPNSGKGIQIGQPVTVQVRDACGTLSNEVQVQR